MSSRNGFQFEKKHLLCLQETRKSSSPMTMYLLPFLMGFVVGGGLVCLAYLECLGGLWACPQQGEVEVLVQVAPDTRSLQGDVIQNLSAGGVPFQHHPSAGRVPFQHHPKAHVVSLLPGCPSRPLHLFILVLSAPSGSLRRTAIRGTWVHDYRNRVVKVTTKFLVGTYELEEERASALGKEEEMFGDLLLLKGLKDSYWNLSAKVLLGLEWANDNLEFDYLVKVDDDSYVRVEGISNVLRELHCDKHLYWGYFMGQAFPEPTGKWAELKWFHCPHYLPYAMGGGYVISQRTVRMLVQFSDRLILYNNEDVTVASWLAPYRLNRKHDIRFNVESLSHGCNNGYLISHKEKVRSFYVKYSSLIKNGTLCEQEKEIHPAYIYNWTGSPLDCCKRVKGLPVK